MIKRIDTGDRQDLLDAGLTDDSLVQVLLNRVRELERQVRERYSRLRHLEIRSGRGLPHPSDLREVSGGSFADGKDDRRAGPRPVSGRLPGHKIVNNS